MAEIGTPENPEIIDPSIPPHQAVTPSRWCMARQIVVWLVGLLLPAVVFDLLCLSFFRMATTYGGILPWMGLVILMLPALLFSLVAFIGSVILIPLLVLTLMGRARGISMVAMSDPRMQRFMRGNFSGRRS